MTNVAENNGEASGRHRRGDWLPSASAPPMPAAGPRPHRKGRRRVLFGASVLATVAVASVVVAAPWNNPWAGDPLGNTRFFVDPYSQAKQAAAASSTDAARASLLGKIAGQPTGTWLGAEIAPPAVRDVVRNVLREAAAQRAVPLFVLYAFPFRGCTGNGDQGAVSATAAGYQQWIEQVALGIGTSKAVVVVEPDALAQYVTLNCLTAGQQAFRLAVLRAAVARLAKLPHAVVYLDAGNARWQPVPLMARLLRAAGVLTARGFALNVSNFDTTSAEASYGDQLSARLDNAHFVIDTSRNGAGSPPQSWCNPPGQALGLPPTADTPDPRVDAWLWIKPPGFSDGTCGGGPPAGTFWLTYAISLAASAPW
jgi:endoglucanase